jgi:nucleotide-binding universal stress UspA family protein
MTRVLIAVDGTPESHDAARFAHTLLGDTAEYLVVTVADTGGLVAGVVPVADPTFAGGGAYISPEVARETVESAMHEAEETANDAAHEVDPNARTIVETGEPGDVIVRVAQERAVDLIVVGSHSRGWLSRLLTPSVRNHLLEHAPCPVLVVR